MAPCVIDSVTRKKFRSSVRYGTDAPSVLLKGASTMTSFLKNAISTTKEILSDHYDTLLGERPAGSQWGRDFTEADFDLPWSEAEVPSALRIDGCRYFRLDPEVVKAEFHDATLGAVPFKDLPAALIGSIRIEDGAHGSELRATVPAEVFDGLADVTEAWIIVGKHDGRDVVFTAHPGPVMAPLPKDLANVTLDDLAHVAVKIERGE
jgi:hypothetical protein